MAVKKVKEGRDTQSLRLIKKLLMRLATAQETRQLGVQQLRLAAYALAEFDLFKDKNILVEKIAEDLRMQRTNVSRALNQLGGETKILVKTRKIGTKVYRKLYGLKRKPGPRP